MVTATEARKITDQANEITFKEYDAELKGILESIKNQARAGSDWLIYSAGDIGGPYIAGKLRALGYKVIAISQFKWEVQW